MATKKQKREAAQARREAFLAEVAADGKTAQEWDRQRRAAKAAQAKLTKDERIKREATTEALKKLLPVG